ncbi:MAG: DegT/DnrJ/EryC1/StrS family aminotransferase [Flavobacterium sp.]
MILVTKTFLPPQEEYNKQIKRAWDNAWLTNRGELTLELEQKLKQHLGISNIIMTNNGTLPIQIALKLLAKGGEVITTPFSYVATSAAIIWENCKPVFVDIDPDHLTIDESKIEDAITSKTTSILATHVFGNPCNVEVIESIAKKHNLSVIYDAAHCFGVNYKAQSIFNYGDVSTCSFHATKIFHTAEGGAMFCNDEKLYHKLYYSHNFGHNGPLEFHGLGINAKISELQSAMGLSIFPYIKTIFSERKKVVDFYNAHLNFSLLSKIKIRENTQWNYSYYPVIFDSQNTLLKVLKALENENVIPRRYFYPSLNTIPYVNGGTMPISESISERIVCLPLYVGLNEIDLEKIVTIINKNIC